MVKTIRAGEENPYLHYKPSKSPSETISEGKAYTVLTYDKKYTGGYRFAQFLKAFFLTFLSLGFALLSPNIRRSFKKAVEGHSLKTLWIEKGPNAPSTPPETTPKAQAAEATRVSPSEVSRLRHPTTLASQPIPEDGGPEFSNLAFFSEYFQDRFLLRSRELITIAYFSKETMDARDVAEFLVSNYVDYKKETAQNFSMPDTQKEELTKAITAQLKADRLHHEEPPNPSKHPQPRAAITVLNLLEMKEEEVKIYPTKGDGSCGFHAMLGEYRDGTYQCDAAKTRENFCNWLRRKKESKELPDCIKAVLTDYFLRFSLSHPGFRDNKDIKEIRKDFFAQYEPLAKKIKELSLRENKNCVEQKERALPKLKDLLAGHTDLTDLLARLEFQIKNKSSSDRDDIIETLEALKRNENTSEISTLLDEMLKREQEVKQIVLERQPLTAQANKIVDQFIDNDIIFYAYLDNLKRIETYLLQDELEAAAIFYNKRVILYQPSQVDNSAGCKILNEAGETTVYVWYNGVNHYERVTV